MWFLIQLIISCVTVILSIAVFLMWGIGPWFAHKKEPDLFGAILVSITGTLFSFSFCGFMLYDIWIGR